MSRANENSAKTTRMTQAERTALSDQRMFAAAMSLINEHGTQKTTLKEIGELAGYSRGLANYRFGSKEGFLGELFTYFDGLWSQHLIDFTAEKTGLDAIYSALDALRTFLTTESSSMRAMYILWYESLGHQSEMRTRLAKHHVVYRDDVQRWLEEGITAEQLKPDINAEQIAFQYCAFIFGTVYQWLVDPDALDLDVVFDEYLSTLSQLISIEE